MPDQLEQIVQRMIDAGEPEENIATVISGYKPAPQGDTYQGPTTFVGGAMKSLGETAKATGAGIIRGALSMINPLTYVDAAAKGQADSGQVDQYLLGQRDALPPSHLGEDMRALTTPEGGGEAIGGLAMGVALPRISARTNTVMQRGGLRMMQSALKPSASLEHARAGAGFGSKEAIAKAVLDEGRNVTTGGLEKAQTALDATDAAAHAALTSGAGAGVTVDPFKVTQAIDAQGGQTFGKQINAQPDTAAISQVRENFANNPHISDPVTGMAPIPADLAHEFATNTGKNLKGKFGRLGGATVEAEKAGRASITGQLRDQIPELEPLWKQEAQQITVRDALEQALARTGNRDPIGLGTIVGAVKNPALAAVGALDRGAPVKSMVARGLYNVKTPTEALRAALLARLMASHQTENAQGR